MLCCWLMCRVLCLIVVSHNDATIKLSCQRRVSSVHCVGKAGETRKGEGEIEDRGCDFGAYMFMFTRDFLTSKHHMFDGL